MRNYVRTSDYPAGLYPIPEPESPTFSQRFYGLALDAGLYEFSYSLVAENGKISAMSPTVQLELKWNSNYGVRFNDDKMIRAVGRILWSRRVNGTPGVTAHQMEYDWRPAGSQLDCNNAQSTPRPFLHPGPNP